MGFHRMAEFFLDTPLDHHYHHHGLLLPLPPSPLEEPFALSFLDFFHPKASSSFSFHLDSDLFDSSFDLVKLHSTPLSSSFTCYRKEFHSPSTSAYHFLRSTTSSSTCAFLKSPAASKCPHLHSPSSACPFLKSPAASKCPVLQSPSSACPVLKSPAASKCPFLHSPESKCPVLRSPAAKCPFLPPLTASSVSYLASSRIDWAAEAEQDAIIKCLSDRVSALELGFDEIFSSVHHRPKICKGEWEGKGEGRDVLYCYKFEPEGKKWGKDVSYSYKVETEADGKQKWTAEIKGLHGKDSRMTATYKLEASDEKGKGKGKEEKSPAVRVVEIEGGDLHKQELLVKRRAAAVAAIKKRGGKGKKKEFSPQDAALIIQVSYRAHLVHRSQTLRGLRDLAVAKAKLAELRSFFHFSYRRLLTVDAEERQRLLEKIIVLLLTVEAIEGTDLMIREARRSMIRELEAVLDAVDPQPASKLASFKRRRFDLPGHCNNAELTGERHG